MNEIIKPISNPVFSPETRGRHSQGGIIQSHHLRSFDHLLREELKKRKRQTRDEEPDPSDSFYTEQIECMISGTIPAQFMSKREKMIFSLLSVIQNQREHFRSLKDGHHHSKGRAGLIHLSALTDIYTHCRDTYQNPSGALYSALY